MIYSHDVGSLPTDIDTTILQRGARRSQTLLPLLKLEGEAANKLFEDEVVRTFSDKIKAEIDIPNYPQLRDMNEMFFELIKGIEKIDSGHAVVSIPSAKPRALIPEVSAIRRNISNILGLSGAEKIRIKVCVTGPYTLSSFFRRKEPQLFLDIGRAVAEIASNSIFSSRSAEVSLLCIDEPVFGFLDDPLLDYGANGREAIKKAWNDICHIATARDVDTAIHLHNTSDDLFWDVERLQIIESHIDDPLYTSESTKRKLEETDKKLKASICVTDFNRLIEEKLTREGSTDNQQELIGDVWSEINRGHLNPTDFLEESKTMLNRLRIVINRFGSERVPYAGPECGLKSFPTYQSSMECLRRVSEAIREYNMDPIR
jgi:5-methyltetrahydropteroyltriglutamate--homocysteine methyltransferase